MNALTWTKHHLPHHHAHHGENVTSAPARRSDHRRTVVAAVVAAYLVTLLALALAGNAVFGMSARESWGFALGVASYILLFGTILGGMIWAVAHNAMDDPNRL